MKEENYKAIFKRKSTRKYSDKPLNKEDLIKIREMSKRLSSLYDDINLQVHLVKNGKKVQEIMRGLIGDFGKIKAPHYLVVTSEVKDGYMENAGYAVEDIVLKLTSMNIANCWLGGHVKDNDVLELLNLSNTQRSIVLISFGYPANEKSPCRNDLNEFKRKELSELVIGEVDSTWQKILEAAQLAPSAGNSQPWRFCADDKHIHVYCAESKNPIARKLFSKINKLDVGIALKHIYIAGAQLNKEIKFEKIEALQREKMIYMISIKK